LYDSCFTSFTFVSLCPSLSRFANMKLLYPPALAYNYHSYSFVSLSLFLSAFLSFFLACLLPSSSILYPQVHHHRHQFLSLFLSSFFSLSCFNFHFISFTSNFTVLQTTDKNSNIYVIRSSSRDALHRANHCRLTAHTHIHTPRGDVQYTDGGSVRLERTPPVTHHHHSNPSIHPFYEQQQLIVNCLYLAIILSTMITFRHFRSIGCHIISVHYYSIWSDLEFIGSWLWPCVLFFHICLFIIYLFHFCPLHSRCGFNEWRASGQTPESSPLLNVWSAGGSAQFQGSRSTCLSSTQNHSFSLSVCLFVSDYVPKHVGLSCMTAKSINLSFRGRIANYGDASRTI